MKIVVKENRIDLVRENYDELYNIVSTLESLIDETTTKDYKEDLENTLMYYKNLFDEAEQELEELEAQEYEQENKEREREYIASQL